MIAELFLLFGGEMKKKGLLTNGIRTRVFYSLTSLCCFISEAADTTLTKNPLESFLIHFFQPKLFDSRNIRWKQNKINSSTKLWSVNFYGQAEKKLLKEAVDRITSFFYF